MSKLFLILITIITTFLPNVSTKSLEIIVLANQQKSMSIDELNDLKNLRLSINSQPNLLYPTSDNKFLLPSLSKGIYFIEVVSKFYLFQALNIQIKQNGDAVITAIHPWSRRKIARIEMPRIRIIERINYFDVQSTFSLVSLLSNSYVMMIGFGMLMMFCYNNVMPKLEEAQNAQIQQDAR